MWYTYILLCDQKTYYVGLSSNVHRRFESHKAKKNIATKEFSDFQLVYYETFNTRREAESRERQIKGWTVAKKKALIDGDISKLIELSKTRSLLKVTR